MAYVLLNDKIANSYYRSFDYVSIDIENIDTKKLQEHYKNAQIKTDYVVSDSTNSFIEFEQKIQNAEYKKVHWEDSTITIMDTDIMYIIERDSIQILYQDQDAVALCDELITLLPIVEEEPKEAEVKLVAINQGEYYTINSKIANTTVNINENYNDDFKPVYDDIVNFINDRRSGLIVLRGEKGTGKTTLIRNLISSVPKNYILITNAVAEHLASPEFISFMLDHKDSVYILEDCEQVLMKRTDSFGFNGAITNILNMSDGLMSDIFNVKFICTFNADIDKIDEALLRKGRCFANYEFKKLSADKTKTLLEKNNITLDKYEPMTLADIYNYDKASCEEKPVKKIGF